MARPATTVALAAGDLALEEAFVFPTSFAQERLWLLDRLEGQSSAYNLPLLVELSGELDLAALERALFGLVERHESLRTTFYEEEGAIWQAVRSAEPTLEVLDLTGRADAREAALRLAAEEAGRPFDLVDGPLFRAGVIKTGKRRFLLLLRLHHIVADGWSMSVLSRDLRELYAAALDDREPNLPRLPLQYADFAVWQREWLQGDRLEEQLEYWRQQLAGAPEVLELPTDRPRPPAQSFRGAHRRRLLPPSLVERLRALATAEGATLFMVLLAGFNALLARYSGRDDIVVGTPIANRSRVELEDLIGFFANTLVLRTDLGGDPTFLELLRRTKHVTLDAFAHQDLPFERLVADLNPARQRSYAPLFQVLFVMQHARGGPLQLPGLEAEAVELERGTAKFDLALFMVEWDDAVRASFEYSTDLFDGDTIERMLGHLATLLEAAAEAPGRRLSELPLLTEGERARLATWNETAQELPGRNRCVHELVEAQVARTPSAPAVSFGGETLSYAELNRRADALAARLRALGIGPDVPVGICADRSLEAIVAVLATLKAGGAFAPLDPAYPAARLAFMLEDLAPPVLLVQRGLLERLPEHEAAVVVLGEEDALLDAIPQASRPARAEDLAYVVFTSGSTGRPKGVAMPHATLANLVAWQLESWTPPAAARTLQFASLSFDVAYQELFTTWSSGGTLVMVDESTRRNPEALLEVLAQERIERLFVPFVALHHLAEASERIGLVPSALREVLTVGETLRITPAIRRFFGLLDGGVLQNQYGATEFHTASQQTLDGPPVRWPARPPIGGPLANARIHLLDRHGNGVPIGVPGELYVAGPVLARGYVNRPELTVERFVPDPFSNAPGARMYRTGDVARRLPDGRIEHLGRLDNQVKFRGYRVELGEIEAVLLGHPQVREAAAVLRESGAGNTQLIAYVAGPGAAAADLRGFLRARLPEFMVPGSIVVLEALPLSPNRKVDREALPALWDEQPAEAVYQAPRDETEGALEAIWRDALGSAGPIGVHDDFFELGGHSLLAVDLFARIERKLGVRLPLALLFQGATIADLAAGVRRERGRRDGRWSALMPLREEGTGPPLFLVGVLRNGQLLKYRELLRHLPADQRVYGFQAIGLDGRALPHDTVEAMAAEYVEEIRRFQARGPYLLGGLCFAGVVAYEMARQLAELGEETALLALIDSSPLVHGTLRGTRGRLDLEREKLARFVRGDLRFKREWIARRLRGVKDKVHLHTGRFVYERLIRSNRRLPHHPWNMVFVANVLAMERYATPRTGVRVTLIRGQTEAGLRETRWTGFAGGGVELRPIVAPGVTHYNILREPYVQRVAVELTDAIAAAGALLGGGGLHFPDRSEDLASAGE